MWIFFYVLFFNIKENEDFSSRTLEGKREFFCSEYSEQCSAWQVFSQTGNITMKQGWLPRGRITANDMIESELKRSRIATVDSCFDLVGSHQQDVAAKSKPTGLWTDCLLNAYGGNNLRWNSNTSVCGLVNVQCHMQNAWPPTSS